MPTLWPETRTVSQGSTLANGRAVGLGAVARDPVEVRLGDPGLERVERQLELVVAEGGVVELGRVERLDHLAAASSTC